MLNINNVIVGKKYVLTYNDKRVVCTVLSIDDVGDCEIKYANGKKDTFHYSWLEKIN